MRTLVFFFLVSASFLSDTLIDAGPNLNDCTKLKVKDLNDHPNSCSDERITADCLNKFDTKGLGHPCLDKLRPKTMEDLTAKTVGELTNGNKEDLPKTVNFIRVLLSKRKDWNEDKAKELLKWIVDDETFIDRLLDKLSFPRNLLAHLFVAHTVPQLKASSCSKITKELAIALPSDAFKEITPNCFHALKPEVFEVMDAEFFKHINPKAFVEITSAQSANINTNSVRDMTKEQAENWGVEPKLPPINKSDKDTAEGRAIREKYRKEHPCFQVKKWIDNTPPETARSLHRRCDQIINWGAKLTASTGMTLMASAVAIFILIL